VVNEEWQFQAFKPNIDSSIEYRFVLSGCAASTAYS